MNSVRMSTLAYCQFLLSTQINDTLTYFADHVTDISHDRINRYLRGERLRPHLVWENVKATIIFSDNGDLMMDDTVLDKRYSSQIGGVRSQYSGNANAVINGIGVVNCVYVNPDLNRCWEIDYRIDDPALDGKALASTVTDDETSYQNFVSLVSLFSHKRGQVVKTGK